MVGLVIVSHSAALAGGVVELAREMGGPDVAIEAAGGLDDGAMGTDAALVLAAVERVRSPDGVLVLMDLGSALMSAEMATEMADPDGGPVLLSAAPLVEGAVAAAARARGGAPLEEVAAEARAALAMKTSQLGEEEEPAPVEVAEADGDWAELRLVVRPRLGLHARPAARLVEAVAGLDAQVQLHNVTRDRGPADARSLTGIATLSVRQGDEIAVRARGGEAEAALAAVRALADANFGDAPDEGDAAAGTTPGSTAGAAADSTAGATPDPPPAPPPTRPPAPPPARPRPARPCAASPPRPASPSGPRGCSSRRSRRSPTSPPASRPRSGRGWTPRAPRSAPSSRPPTPPLRSGRAARRPRSSRRRRCCSTTPR